MFQPQVTSQVPTAAPTAAQPQDQPSQLQAQQLQLQIQEQQAKLQQQLLQLNAAAAGNTQQQQQQQQQPAPTAPCNKPDAAPQAMLLQPAPTMGSISMDPRSAAPGTVQISNPTPVVAEHFTKDLKEAYDLHLQQQQQQQQQQNQAAAAAAGKSTPSPVMGGFAALNGLNLSSGMVGNIPTMPQQQNNNGGGVAPRSDEDRAAGTALLGFLSSLRQSYEDALRDQSIPATAAQPTTTVTATNAAAAQMSLFKSDSSDENCRTATVITDSNAGSNQPDSSVEDSDWNSDKAKTDPSSSEDSDKETPGGASPKRQKVSAEV